MGINWRGEKERGAGEGVGGDYKLVMRRVGFRERGSSEEESGEIGRAHV